MKETDDIIKIFSVVHDKKTERRIAYYGWDSKEPIVAFYNYADSYRLSADILFEQFQKKETPLSDLDRLGFAICFLYRQSIELSLKFVYMTCRQSDANNEAFLNKGHRLLDLWDTIRPLIVSLINDAKEIRHYIKEFCKFDPDSMMMRYPVKKNNTPNKTDTKLDIVTYAQAAQELQSRLIEIGEFIRNQCSTGSNPCV